MTMLEMGLFKAAMACWSEAEGASDWSPSAAMTIVADSSDFSLLSLFPTVNNIYVYIKKI